MSKNKDDSLEPLEIVIDEADDAPPKKKRKWPEEVEEIVEPLDLCFGCWYRSDDGTCKYEQDCKLLS